MAAERCRYFHSLVLDTKKRYVAKTSLLGGVDPNALKQWDFSQDIALLPLLRHLHTTLCSYLSDY